MKFKLFAIAAALALALPIAHAQKTLKYAHFQPAKDDQPKTSRRWRSRNMSKKPPTARSRSRSTRPASSARISRRWRA